MDLRILSGALVVTQMGCTPSPRVGFYWTTRGELRDGCGTYDDSHPPYIYVAISNATDFTLWFEASDLVITEAECELDGRNFSCNNLDSDDLYIGTVRSGTSFSLLWSQHRTRDVGLKTGTCSDLFLDELEWDSDLPDVWVEDLQRESAR